MNSRTFDYLHIIRNIQKNPVKTLDASSLNDDFYLDILDWSKKGTVSIVLKNDVFFLDYKNDSVNQLKLDLL